MEINMGKTVFMFPGQGAQYIGMAKDFYDAIPECREVFEEASEASGLDIAALCFEENDKINITDLYADRRGCDPACIGGKRL